VCYRKKGDYELALEYLGESLHIERNVHRPDHPSIALTLNNLANVYRNRGDYKLALECYQESLDIKKKAHHHQLQQSDENVGTLATTLNNIAIVYDDMGDCELALEYYQESLDIFMKASDHLSARPHPVIVVTLHNMGLYFEANRNSTKITRIKYIFVTFSLILSLKIQWSTKSFQTSR
jgi:tetratricopeptide (TPR) repeat protein